MMDEAVHTAMPCGGGKPKKATRASNGSLEGATDKTGWHVSGPHPHAARACANLPHGNSHPGAHRAKTLGEEETRGEGSEARGTTARSRRAPGASTAVH